MFDLLYERWFCAELIVNNADIIFGSWKFDEDLAVFEIMRSLG